MSVEEQLRAEMTEATNRLTLDPPSVSGLIRGARRRRGRRLAVTGAVGVLLVATLSISLVKLLPLAGDRVQPGALPSLVPPSPTASSAADCGQSPWSSCHPAAAWLTDVLKEVGYPIVRDNGASYMVDAGDGITFFIHAFDATEPEALAAEGYREFRRAHGIAILAVPGYPGERQVWQVQGLDIWLENNLTPLPGPEIIDPLVKATVERPFDP